MGFCLPALCEAHGVHKYSPSRGLLSEESLNCVAESDSPVMILRLADSCSPTSCNRTAVKEGEVVYTASDPAGKYRLAPLAKG